MRKNLQQLIRDAFPPVGKPSRITVHGDKCYQCSWTIEELRSEQSALLSNKGVRWLLGELSILSAEGFRWVLPSYLDAIVTDDANIDLGEFLAYHFKVYGSVTESEAHEQIERINILNLNQVDCLIQVLHYIREELGDIYFGDVDEAINCLAARRIKLTEQDVTPNA